MAVRVGGIVTVTVASRVNLPDFWSKHTLGALGEGLRPASEISAPIVCAEAPSVARMVVAPSGSVYVQNMSGTTPPKGRMAYGSLCYAAV